MYNVSLNALYYKKTSNKIRQDNEQSRNEREFNTYNRLMIKMLSEKIVYLVDY